ncbi:type I secretion protein, ATP-binding protein [Salmonella enterica subsp. enterica]|uniref:Type I secretion protein, ATP-binding protein n=1 Tax=Salmonella enterica I TaxID=59201 RepID=A0A379UTQ8_SALET|nr:type I secretion protein, ATP-binding protein [Salmonella enterica subsp. enterica]
MIISACRTSIWRIYAATSAFLSQNARLFFGTLRENLTLGAPHANDEQIFDALEVSGGAVFVRRLAKGLDHPIMEGGNGLSGGQRQSLLLARMLLRSPNIVLLDEPAPRWTSIRNESLFSGYISGLAIVPWSSRRTGYQYWSWLSVSLS